MTDPWIPDAKTPAGDKPPPNQVFYQHHGFDEVLPADWEPEGSQWPHPNFDVRNAIFARLKKLRGGDLGFKDGALGTNLVYVNGFAQYSRRLSYLLAMGRPTLGGERIPIAICVDWIDDLSVFGGAIVAWTDGGFQPVEPADWYPREGGGAVTAIPWHSGEENHADRIEVAEWWPEGQVVIAQHAYDGTSSIGGRLEEEAVAGMIAAAPAPPRRGHTRQWGTTKYPELFPILLEIARRFSRGSKLFDLFSGPIPVFDESETDARRRFNVPADATDDQAKEEILAGQLGVFSEYTIHKDDTTLNVSLLQPHMQGADYALRTTQELIAQAREIANIPDLTGRTLSGEALKRLFVHFYAESDVYLEVLTDTIEDTTGERAEWTHPFDSGMFAAAVTGPPSPDDDTPPPKGGDGDA
ncbi:hypothetical protein F4Y93_12230 [Candidatus Poribacteria bacterium]|nr:hypothetical protein [Candidatus Poribacteria bacterium]